MKAKHAITFLIFLMTFTLICVQAAADSDDPPHNPPPDPPDCDPACDNCHNCENGNCENICTEPGLTGCCNGECYDGEKACCSDVICEDPDATCCPLSSDGECCSGSCCDNITCYDPATHKCCDYGTGQICEKAKQCCLGGACCDTPNCKICVNEACEDKCDPALCQTCDGQGHCIVCNGDSTKCCDNGNCVDKCTNTGQCDYGELPSGPYANCQALQNPITCQCEGAEGLVCNHFVTIALSDAECAGCAPDCAKARICPCAEIVPVRCKTHCYLVVCSCLCDDFDWENAECRGDHYECVE